MCDLTASPNEDVGGGRTFNMAAEVGLLTRNVKIRGKDYDNGRTMPEQGFGGRLLVSSYAAGDEFKTGA